MTKFGILGAALVASSLLAAPVMAKESRTSHLASTACDPRDPGNPYSRTYDYMTWSAWRKRGSWDDRNEYTCQPIPSYARHQGW
jgi:hypothetical protein